MSQKSKWKTLRFFLLCALYGAAAGSALSQLYNFAYRKGQEAQYKQNVSQFEKLANECFSDGEWKRKARIYKQNAPVDI